VLPCVVFEDEHLLVVNKPAGLNTHAPAPFAGEGLYEWLRHREPRWARLAILHRLDKETSGVLVFGKTTQANRSLTEQFTRRLVRKKYLLLTDRPTGAREWAVRSRILRAGDRYVSGARGEPAETCFRPSSLKSETSNLKWIEAEPRTGRTHQIRLHAAQSGVPILGDVLYGGSPFVRVCLQAAQLTLRHPATGAELTFDAPPDFAADPRLALRAALIDPRETSACRVIHGAGDGFPGWYVDQLGPFLLSRSERAPGPAQATFLGALLTGARGHSPGERPRGAYHRSLDRPERRGPPAASSPRPLMGDTAPDRFTVLENGLRFELSFAEGGSMGLFLDQRDNRRRVLTGHVAADFPLFGSRLEARNPRPETRNPGFQLLNAFAYTCAFSVCGARAGARVTSLDLSRKYLDWGRRNFALNGLDPAAHDFIHGDVLDWLRRLGRKGRRFDVILLDPPTFSRSRPHGVFRVEKDLGRLVGAALPLLPPGGVLFASTNAAGWAPEKFLATVTAAVHTGHRKIRQRHYVPQPPDFPVSRAEPPHLKTLWMRIE
jgi:23S rRNA (cytosine1962-C5)-methyltransferase